MPRDSSVVSLPAGQKRRSMQHAEKSWRLLNSGWATGKLRLPNPAWAAAWLRCVDVFYLDASARQRQQFNGVARLVMAPHCVSVMATTFPHCCKQDAECDCGAALAEAAARMPEDWAQEARLVQDCSASIETHCPNVNPGRARFYTCLE